MVDFLVGGPGRGKGAVPRPSVALLRVAGFARWEIYGDFGGRPLTRENDEMVVTAWNE